jgi:hypothetical protein
VFGAGQAASDIDDAIGAELFEPLAIEGLGPGAKNDGQFVGKVRRFRLSALLKPKLANGGRIPRQNEVRVAASDAFIPALSF